MVAGDIGLDEKRVYSDRTDTTTALVATEVGLVRVDVSGDIVGEFRLLRRGPVADVTAASGRVSIATGEDVFVEADGSFEPTGFGAATAVDDDGEVLLAAGQGRVAALVGDDGWTTLGAVDEVRAIDAERELLATASGVHRLDGDYVGLEDANDVTAGPLVATDTGLYRLGNGWMCELDVPVRAVEVDGERGHAGGERLYEYDGESWIDLEVPTEEPIADVTHGQATYVVTRQGTFLVNDGDGWRARSLGTPGVHSVSVTS